MKDKGSNLTKTKTKTFFWKDKSGRGFKNKNLKTEDLKKLENDEDWDGIELHQWAEDAEEDDKWEDNANVYICTKS